MNLAPSRNLAIQSIRCLSTHSRPFWRDPTYTYLPSTLPTRQITSTSAISALRNHKPGLFWFKPQVSNAQKKTMSMFRGQVPLKDSQVSFKGKTVLVTGSNTGLGFEAAVKFAARGAERVILAVRDLSKGDTARASIEERTGNNRVDVLKLDMGSYDSIQKFSKRIEQEAQKLDVAVLNAGVFMTKYEESRYGWEQTLQVNALSTALLGILLLPILRKKKANNGSLPVMEFVASLNYAKVELPSEQQSGTSCVLATYNRPEAYVASKQYAASKLFVTCAMQTLALLAQSPDGRPDVIVNACCPGYCASDLSRGHKGFLMDVIRWLANKLILRTTEEGARALVSGTTAGEEGHGKLWRDDEIKADAPILDGEKGEALRKKLWTEVIDALRTDIPTIDQMVAKLQN